jgi:glutathione S-transferase
MALKNSGIKTELREVSLKDLPDALVSVSDEKTIPVLVLPDNTVLSESWDIVKWAVTQHDPDLWLGEDNKHRLNADILIETHDFSFKPDLDRYKYADRHPEHSVEYYRKECEIFIAEIEEMLTDNTYVLDDHITLADIGILPFIRQFSMVDKEWFATAPYPKVQHWLTQFLGSTLFKDSFKKHELWQSGSKAIYI